VRAPFVGRETELTQLGRLWNGGRAGLLVLTGRRRVGKSRLLEHFFADKPHLYLVGTAQTQGFQLADAAREIHRATGDPLLAHQGFESWESLLAYLTRYTSAGRVGIVFDEFSYYVDQAPTLPSLLQRWWDQEGERGRGVVVLASSHGRFMERLFAADQPLYGRRTAELRLDPLDYADAGRFFPSYAAADRLRAYAVFGGTPAYLAACDPTVSLADNLRQRVLADDAWLRREPLYLLAQERSVSQPATYLSVLRAIATGQAQPHLIARAAGFRSPADIGPALARLQELGLVERLVPITAPPRGRVSRYALTDPFLAFWLRFVQPAEALLERGFADLVLADVLGEPGGLDDLLSRAQGPWQRAGADYLWRALRVGRLGSVRFELLGPWWEGRGATDSAEIDLVGRLGGRTSLIASCEWRDEDLKPTDLAVLRRVAARVGGTDDTPAVLFSRRGFDPALVARARNESILLVTPEDMYAPAVGDGLA
jgi:AAA+ ATPase superfamily predicted ATPase